MAADGVDSTERGYWRTMYTVTHAIASSLDLEEVLRRLVRSIAEAMGVKAAALRLLAANGEVLTRRASFGLSDHYLNKGPVDRVHSPLDREALQGTAVWVEDVRTDPRFQYQAEAAQEGLVSVLCVPVSLHGTQIGVLRVYTDERRSFDPEEVEFVTALAELGAVAIENARMHEELRQDFDQTVGALWGVETATR